MVNTIATGDFFGELVLDGQARAASVMTLEPSRFFVIPQRDAEAFFPAIRYSRGISYAS